MAVISNKNMLELLNEDKKRNAADTVRDNSILDGRGRLLVTGRYSAEPRRFDRGKLPALRRLFRLKETESCTVMSDRLFMYISAGEAGYAGFVRITAVNRLTGYQKTRTRLFPLTFGSMDMPSSPVYGDVMLRKGDVALDFSRSPTAKYIRCLFEDFDDVRTLYINLEMELPESVLSRKKKELPETGAYYSLRSFPVHSGSFSYSAYMPCMKTSGTVVLGADRFDFSGGQCFSSCEWMRGVPPYRSNGAVLTVCGGTDGNRLGISVTPDGTMIHNGDSMFIGEPVGFDFDVNDPMKPLTLRDPDGRLELEFTPLNIERDTHRFAGLLRYEDWLVFGTTSGCWHTDGMRTMKFEDMFAGIRYFDARW